MILMSDRSAEQRENAVSRRLRHIALVAMNGVHHQFGRRIDDSPRLFGIEVLHQVHRPFDVGE
jgi:hypothetical protein